MSYYWSGWAYVLIGSLAIAVGGFFTTKGWSEFNNHSQREALMGGSIREWQQNDRILAALAQYESTIDSAPKPRLFPTFGCQGVQSLSTSHLFKRRDKKEAALLDAIWTYLPTCSLVNDSIRKVNNFASGQGRIDIRKKQQKNLLVSPLYARFRESHDAVGEALKKFGKVPSQDSEEVSPLEPAPG